MFPLLLPEIALSFGFEWVSITFIVTAIKFLLVVISIFTASLLKPRFYSNAHYLLWPISTVFIPTIITYPYDDPFWLWPENFLRILFWLPFIIVPALFNISFGLLDGAVFKLVLSLDLNESLMMITLLNIALHIVETCQSVMYFESWDFEMLARSFKWGLFCASERAISHIIGILLFYYSASVLQ
jgi:hypothetical protein